MSRLQTQFGIFMETEGSVGKWLMSSVGMIYVRRSRMFLDRKLRCSVEILNIRMEVRGKGHFKKFLTYVEEHPDVEAVVIDSVMEPRLVNHLTKRGYKFKLSGNTKVETYGTYYKIFR